MGKKSGPAAPTPPDPVAVANAQGQQNKDAAVTQANLNRIDQYAPQGSLQYIQTGTNSDGTPAYSSYQTYSPDEMAKYNAGNSIELSLDNLAQNNVSRVNQAQATPFSFDGMSPVTDRVGYNLPGIQSAPTAPQLQSGINNPGNISTSYGSGGNITGGYGSGGNIASGYGAGGTIAQGFNAPGQSLSYGVNGQPIQTSFSSPRDVNYMGGGEGGNVQQGLDYGRLSQLPGINDFNDESQRVGNATYSQATSRLDPQFQNQKNDLTSTLANQGIPVGSQAYERAMTDYSNQKNDAYNQANYSAIQAASAERTRLFNDALAARGQGASEVQNAGNFANAAQGQIFGQALGATQANNAAQGQQFGQKQSLADFYNSAQGQQFAQGTQNAQLNNNAWQQQFGANQAQAAFQNQAQGQQNAQNANAAAFQNQSQAQQNAQNASAAAFQNQAQGQQNQQNQQAAAFNNAGQDQTYQQSLGLADLFNTSNQSNFGNLLTADQFNNQARGQAFNEQVTNANMGNAARQQQIQEASYLRNLPLNEISALMSGNNVQNPNFASVPQVGVAAPDYQGAVYQNYNGALQQYQAQQQARSQMLGAIFGSIGSLGSAAITHSDRRVKEAIVRVGTLPNGLATYAFNYIGDTVRRFGVMAQDVLPIMPDAVHNLDGVLAVDYRKVFA